MKTTLPVFLFILLGPIAATSTHVRAAEDVAEMFCQAIGRGDVSTVLDLMHPSARDAVDEPVLEAWTIAIQKNLGLHVATTTTAVKHTLKLTGRRVDTDMELTFEKGTATASLAVMQGKIIAFNIQSERMKDWFQGPANIDCYTATAETFISTFLANDHAHAHAMMHPALQKVVTQENLQVMMAKISNNGGPLTSLNLRTHRFSLEGSSPALFLTFDVECERATGTCEIEFQFVGMKGYLLGFDFQ